MNVCRKTMPILFMVSMSLRLNTVESNRLARVGWWDFKNSLLRLSALFSTSLDPRTEMSIDGMW
jgi:hypothetical protein